MYHRIKGSARLAQNILRDGVSAVGCSLRGRVRAYLESIGFAGREGCGSMSWGGPSRAVLSHPGKTHITTLEHPIALSIFVDL